MRFLAFFLVFNHHIFSASMSGRRLQFTDVLAEGASAGVSLFFTLSSFLITELLLREREATGTIHLRAFYARRLLRIWPLYFLALALAMALPHLFPSRFDPSGQYAAPFLLLCGNWAIAHRASWPHNPMLNPLWSISVEEQFYLLWPTLVLICGPRGILRAALLVLPATWALDTWAPALGISKEPGLWCNSLSEFQFFALGALLALLTHQREFHLARSNRLLALAAGLLAFLLSAYPLHFLSTAFKTTPAENFAGYLAVDAGCLLLFCAFLGARVPAAARPLLYLGKISYGLYVFHFAVRAVVLDGLKHAPGLRGALATFAVYSLTLLLTIAVASLSYESFEKPFLRLKSRFTFIPSHPA